MRGKHFSAVPAMLMSVCALAAGLAHGAESGMAPPSGANEAEANYPDPDWRRGFRCTTVRALDKAKRNGFHGVKLTEVLRDRIIVSGRLKGRSYQVVFARQRGCPLISVDEQ